jgi:hypothetical protein
MRSITQISTNTRPGNAALRALKSLLTFIGIQVTHPSRDESLFYETDSYAAWRIYDAELLFYESIANSPFHIIYNDAAIDEEVGLQVAYAMLKNRPILMTGAPVFTTDLSPFIRETLMKHVHTFHLVSLPDFELVELSLLLSKLKPTDYALSQHETVLIDSQVKAHFRKLLEEAKALRLTRSQSPIRPTEEV